jgi:hypothetical protein
MKRSSIFCSSFFSDVEKVKGLRNVSLVLKYKIAIFLCIILMPVYDDSAYALLGQTSYDEEPGLSA